MHIGHSNFKNNNSNKRSFDCYNCINFCVNKFGEKKLCVAFMFLGQLEGSLIGQANVQTEIRLTIHLHFYLKQKQQILFVNIY